MALKSKHEKAVASPDQFLTVSMRAVQWIEAHRAIVFGGLIGVLVLGILYVGFGDFATEGHAAVTRKVTSVLEAESADVIAELPPLPEGADEEDRPLTFRTEKQRSETLVRRYKRLLAANGATDVMAFAHLGLGNVYADRGQNAEAQKEYQEVIDSGVEPLAPFAVEGLMYVLEAGGKRREAMAKVDELKTLQDGKFRNLATYHAARFDIAAGNKTDALDKLRHLQRELAEAPELAFLREQTMTLIGALEAEGVMSSVTGAGDSEGGAAKKKGGGGRSPRPAEGESGDNE